MVNGTRSGLKRAATSSIASPNAKKRVILESDSSDLSEPEDDSQNISHDDVVRDDTPLPAPVFTPAPDSDILDDEDRNPPNSPVEDEEVQDRLPDPNETSITTKTREYFTKSMAERFEAISDLQDPAAAVFPFREIPIHRMHFPTDGIPGLERTDELLIGKQVGKFTCVAALGHNGLVAKSGQKLPDVVSVTFAPLLYADHITAGRILEELSNPRRGS
ncbi:hypothetical protein PsYK624_122470 [Phanerochaete sordida]|uniref:Uncharacterized protein n=1 Tax=Phanerochaete sordida TaxID=48140 RepID=A0A9P3LIV1_9APHY|nr:hypothetical protein PsYK624_122470 [Phanerochaete sordida]